jgi:hypothetical protein
MELLLLAVGFVMISVFNATIPVGTFLLRLAQLLRTLSSNWAAILHIITVSERKKGGNNGND